MHLPAEILARYEIGQHSLTVESNEVVLIIARGRVTFSDAVMIQEKLAESERIYPRFDLIVDLSALRDIESAARQRFVRVERQFPLRRIVIVGTSFALRVMATGLHRAGRTLRPAAFAYAMDAVDTIEEARRLVGQR
jgi:anti-anti-sigma regulatory factor